jgi:homoserine trans-succinylase
MLFLWSKKNKKSSPVSKVDKIVTGLIIGGAVASIFWLSKTKSWKKITNLVYKESKNTVKNSYSIFWKALASFVSLFNKKK